MKQAARTTKQIGAIIRGARRNAGLTQSELAGMIGLRQATISSLERGTDEARLGTLLNVLTALGLQIVIEERGKGAGQALEDLF